MRGHKLKNAETPFNEGGHRLSIKNSVHLKALTPKGSERSRLDSYLRPAPFNRSGDRRSFRNLLHGGL